MPAYDPTQALRLTAPRALNVRSAPIVAGATLLHVAAERLSGPHATETLAIVNRVVDPIPFQDVPPRSLRRNSVWVGKLVALPDGETL